MQSFSLKNGVVKGFILLILSLFYGLAAEAGPYQETANQTYGHYDNTITFQLIPSTYPLQWTTARALLWSLVKNQYFFPKSEMILGHIATEVSCVINGKATREFIGAGPKDMMGFRRHIINGYGFSILNRPGEHQDIPLVKIDGELDNETYDFELFDRMIEKNSFGVLSAVVDETSCQEALDFIRLYKEKAKNGTFYGFGVSPDQFEGAGCAPLAESIMKRGKLSELIKAFERVVYVPRSLLGDPEKGVKVSLLDLLLSNTDMSVKTESSVEFRFPDPQMLYDYLLTLKNDDPKLIKKINFPESDSILAIVKF